MNLGGILIGFMAICLITGMIVFVGATQSTQVVDSQGATSTATGNDTGAMLSNVTAVGGTASGFLILIIAALGVIAAVGLLVLYGKTR